MGFLTLDKGGHTSGRLLSTTHSYKASYLKDGYRASLFIRSVNSTFDGGAKLYIMSLQGLVSRYPAGR